MLLTSKTRTRELQFHCNKHIPESANVRNCDGPKTSHRHHHLSEHVSRLIIQKRANYHSFPSFPPNSFQKSTFSHPGHGHLLQSPLSPTESGWFRETRRPPRRSGPETQQHPKKVPKLHSIHIPSWLWPRHILGWIHLARASRIAQY